MKDTLSAGAADAEADGMLLVGRSDLLGQDGLGIGTTSLGDGVDGKCGGGGELEVHGCCFIEIK